MTGVWFGEVEGVSKSPPLTIDFWVGEVGAEFGNLTILST